MYMKSEAILGGGCFWCIEAVYRRINGVLEAVSGYAGGHAADPSYEAVCSGSTGHAEVVRIVFDTSEISYREILDIFWKAHDPTTLNRQGADTGTQYRSVILYTNTDQKKQAEESIKELQDSGVYANPVVTELIPFEKFYPAEKYHQDYFTNFQNAGYCRLVIHPKLQKLGLT